jgi:hypothetical protein
MLNLDGLRADRSRAVVRLFCKRRIAADLERCAFRICSYHERIAVNPPKVCTLTKDMNNAWRRANASKRKSW